MTRTHTHRESRAAFTLVEMLVSIAVLALIMTFIGQMMSSVTLSTSLSSKHIDTDNQARLVFDRMAMDLAGMPRRPDLEYIFAKQDSTPGSQQDPSDKMYFYSEAPAFFDSNNPQLFPSSGNSDPKSSVALVGYCINTGSNNTGATVAPLPYCMQRLSKGLIWDQQSVSNSPGGVMFLTFNPAGNNQAMIPLAGTTLAGNALTGPAVGSGPSYTGTDADYSTLANQVFRMEFCFEVKDLTPGGNGGTVFSNYPVAVFKDSANAGGSQNTTTIDGGSSADPLTSGSTGRIGDRWYNKQDNRAFELTGYSAPGVTPPTTTWTPIGLSDVTAIVVAIAVMDTNSRKTLSQSQLASAASYLPDFLPEQATNSNLTLSGTTPLMATTWANKLNAQPTTFAETAQITQAAASQIRVYQHVFYLNNN